MDSDDIMKVDRIKKQLDFMKKNPDVAVIGGQFQLLIQTYQI